MTFDEDYALRPHMEDNTYTHTHTHAHIQLINSPTFTKNLLSPAIT